MERDIRHYLSRATEQQDSQALQSAYHSLHNLAAAAAAGGGSSGLAQHISAELHVLCAEAALQLCCLEICKACLKIYFEGNAQANPLLCRAYLCQGRLMCLTTAGNVDGIKEAVGYFLKAIGVAKHESRNHFMVFDASVLYFQTVRPLLWPGLRLHLVPSLRQVVQSLEEVADTDYSWRAELMMHLVECVVDSGEIKEAVDLAKVTEQFIKSHAPHHYSRLFPVMVQHNLLQDDDVGKVTRQDAALALIYKMKTFKKLAEISKDKLTQEDSAKLEEIFVDCTKAFAVTVNHSPMPAQPADRVALLLELALLALQVRHQRVAVDCLKELKKEKEASAGQRIVMKCVNSEINLLKKEAKMNDYSRACVEARLKEIGKLDQWLQNAVKEGDPQAVQAVCATQWRFCLPLLQHNLRKHIRAPLLRVLLGLEDIQSSLLEMRCQIHSEIASIEEEEGRLGASLSHLQKAIQLDTGMHHKRLLSALRLLQLRGTLYQTPSRDEDKAFMLMQQARDMRPEDKADMRPILVAVGLLLGPDDFQIVLDGEKGNSGSGRVAELSARAQHHSTSVQILNGHLARQASDTDQTERMKLWATLAKTARKNDVWDVCRAACRFCLLYDDGRWQISKAEGCRCLEVKTCAECLHSLRKNGVKDHLRLLAEICFVSGEATIQMLLEEGVQLNSPLLPPQKHVSEDDPQWVTYRIWIQDLSAYATSTFLRGAQLGSEIREPWLVENAAVYLWNYSGNLLVAGKYQHLLPSFQSLVEMLRKLEGSGNRTLVVLLCDAVARGLIIPVCGPETIEVTLPADKGKSKVEKGMERRAGVSVDPAALPDVNRALELCEYARHLSNCNIPGEMVPIAAKKQLLATWVQIKMLLHQQIVPKIDVKDENEEGSAMMQVLVGVEMLQCNKNPRHMEFSAPTLSTLVTMASECNWTDAVVELQVWCQLAAFCHCANEHDLVLLCTERALQLGEAAAKSIDTLSCVFIDLSAVNEMLSSVAFLRGLSLIHVSVGDLNAYREALRVILSSISYAEKAGNPVLCFSAARHYWNNCLPLTRNPEERRKLKDPLEKILNALAGTASKHKRFKAKDLLALRAEPRESSKTDEEELTLQAAFHSLLLSIHADKRDWKSALQLLDKVTRDMPRSRHKLLLLKHHIMLKARLGESVVMNMQKLQDEGEQCCWFMWRKMALSAGSVTQKLFCYQKSITSLQSTETLWQKANLILEFAEWLYCHNFPKIHALHQIQWAVDTLLHVEPEQTEGAEDESKRMVLQTVDHQSLVRVQGPMCRNVSTLTNVQHLDGLVRAHTLLAVMSDRASLDHQLNLLRAYAFVLQIWEVSMATAYEVSCEKSKSQLLKHPPSAGSKKGKDKTKSKKDGKVTTPAEDGPESVAVDWPLPSCTEDWACYVCPDEARLIFSANSDHNCINTHNIPKQRQSLFYLNLLAKQLQSISLDHLTLPIMHLSETIANDLLDRRSLSDLYRLRILRTCSQLGLETSSPYQKELPNLCRVQERELMECHKRIVLTKERQILNQHHHQESVPEEMAGPGQQARSDCCYDIWLDKAEVCLSLGLHQHARQLIAGAHLVAKELGDQNAVAGSLLSLATLACEEQNHAQALILLDKAHILGGDEEFWYRFTLTKVQAVVGQNQRDAHTKADDILKQGREALKLVMKQRINRALELQFLITSLEMRCAVESIRAVFGSDPREALSHETVHWLRASCDTLRECARHFTELGYRQQAAEAHAECARGVRILAIHTTDKEEKQLFLLDGFSQMQLAVKLQEPVVLNSQSFLIQQEETSSGMSLPAMRRLHHLRLSLAEFGLALQEERCSEEKCNALSRLSKTSAEIALEEFTRCTPEPGSTEQEWVSACSRSGQVVLAQLSALTSHSSDSMEARARCLCLMGKYLRLQALQEDPVFVCGLWDSQKHEETCSDPDTSSVTDENSESEKVAESKRKEPSMTSASSAEMKKMNKAQQQLSQAGQVLSEAISLCLQHSLPTSLLADASINILECHGQSEPAQAGQYLALFQSCCTVSTAAELLSSACADTSVSQHSALLSLRRKLLLTQEETPSSVLKGVEDSLNSLSEAFNHLTVNPNHLKFLEELPPNLNILLLQHSDDGSALYGAFYETSKAPGNQKRKVAQIAGTLACSKVAKISVCPQALQDLRDQMQAFRWETTKVLYKESCSNGAEDRLEKIAADKKLEPHFCKVVQDMKNYLHPLLTQFDFSRLRLQAGQEVRVETAKSKDKDEKESTSKLPTDPGEYLVLLADRKLLDLPLESLSILQDQGWSSVSRDFSLQLLHARLSRDEVESDNKKETRGGKSSKGRGDQSQSIKVVPPSPSNTFSVDKQNLKYIVDPDVDSNFETHVSEILENHSKDFNHVWQGFSKQTPSLSEMEQLLCKCSALVYLGREPFTAKMPPVKLAALSLSECRIAMLFEQARRHAGVPRHSICDTRPSSEDVFPQRHQDVALQLSLVGVDCIVLNQWHSSLRQNTHNMATVLENLLGLRQTSGQTIHAFRKNNASELYGPVHPTGSKEDNVPHSMNLSASAFNCILYGLPNLIFT